MVTVPQRLIAEAIDVIVAIAGRDQIDRSLIGGLATRRIQGSDRTKNIYVALIRAIFRRAMREWEWIYTVPAFKTHSKGGKVRVQRFPLARSATYLGELAPAE
ncbi:hypothetical protein [Sphingopyxis sp.]|jgi:hypothetical protein|uniref:hypothetical protein n=1 Tax=Sphingopyxis sp. TaxID=1908224 RepID=UPI003FA6C664